ncbi:MAG: glycosyltransferase family 4 protein [Parachlamydiales bacterium]|jgi:glycosyltransferase involved in cell wall biosynthesis
MKKNLNILHLESSPGWGGQEMRILKESLGMKGLGHKVIMAVEKGGGLVKQAREKGFLVYEIKFKKIFWFVSFFKILYIMKKHSIDIANTHSSSDSWLGGISARILGINIIRTRHLSTPIKKGLNSKLLFGLLTDFVVTTCKEVVDVIISQAKKDFNKCKSIPTGVDYDQIKVDSLKTRNFRKSFGIENKDFLIGCVCFMRSWKGIDDFINAAKILENEKDIKFIIIGGGHKEKYIQMAEDLKLKNIIFTGHLEDPYNAINALDVFVLLSTAHEGVSQASLQAAYLKKPLICTSTGGLKEICIHDLTGKIVPLFSPENVSQEILNLKNDEKLRSTLSKNAFDLSLNFSSKNMIRQMNEIYESLTK